jgi:hypothetical protein
VEGVDSLTICICNAVQALDAVGWVNVRKISNQRISARTWNGNRIGHVGGLSWGSPRRRRRSGLRPLACVSKQPDTTERGNDGSAQST